MSAGIDPEELGALAMQLFRERLGLDGQGSGDRRSVELAIAEAKARAELWLGVLDRVERVVDKVLDRIDAKAVTAAAQKALPPPPTPKDDEPEPDVTPLLEALHARPPAPEAAQLLTSWGATAENIDGFLALVRESAPEWAVFLDEDKAWTSSVLDAIKGTPSSGDAG